MPASSCASARRDRAIEAADTLVAAAALVRSSREASLLLERAAAMTWLADQLASDRLRAGRLGEAIIFGDTG